MLALGLLLAALVAILIKDRQFWFGTEQATIDSDMPETTTSQPVVKPAAKNAPAGATHAAKRQNAVATVTNTSASETPAVAVSRTVLPPLDIDVIAGNGHKKLHLGSNVTKLEINGPGAAERLPATQAAEREPVVDAQPAYPPLAQHMNVQGSVVLQAVIGADGIVENLQVLSGPAILASAAQQAVREWRFKPIMQNGQAVESKATITVNFTIKVADSSAGTTLAETRASDALIITR